jgi:hypothetical protein
MQMPEPDIITREGKRFTFLEYIQNLVKKEVSIYMAENISESGEMKSKKEWLEERMTLLSNAVSFQIKQSSKMKHDEIARYMDELSELVELHEKSWGAE